MTTRVVPVPPHEGADLIPIRMCNELVYCPRLFHLEHVQGIFVDSADTIEGRSQHERAERKGRVRRKISKNVAEDGDESNIPEWLAPGLRRRITLESAEWGVRGSVDLVEVESDQVVVVEAKHGSAPRNLEHEWEQHALRYGAWPCDVVQAGLYMAMLREANVPCDEAQVLYRGDRSRACVPWSTDLERFLRDAVAEARRVAADAKPPPPLEHSSKCHGCSLNSVCLPDEHLVLSKGLDEDARVRRIVPGRDDRAVLHVLTPGSMLRKRGDGIEIWVQGEKVDRVLLKDVSQVALYGRSAVTEPCLHALLSNDVPIAHHTGAGTLVGITQPLMTRNVGLRRAQYRGADDERVRLAISRGLVVAKLRNQRTVLKRYRGHRANEHKPTMTLDDSIEAIKIAVRRAESATNVEELRGHEGGGAAAYFKALPEILPPPWRRDFAGRSRRPPRDRVNAMLGFVYALLVRDATAALGRVGLDPMLGLFHTMIPGRPALALDVVEPFRPAWADAAVLRLVATDGIKRGEFHGSGEGVFLSDSGRRTMIRAYERRGDELTTHPRFGYRMSYRRMLELEARVLAKYLVGEIDHFTPLWTR